MEKARLDADSAEVRAILEQDILDAASLNVTRTPGFFVNGRPLKEFGHEQLSALVREQVDLAYSGEKVAR